MTKVFLVIAFVSVSFFAALAQTSQYAGQETRQIKSLSESEIEAYRNGDGMGLAKAGELNGYPGPKHVLELSGELNLTDEQLSQTQALFSSMQLEAQNLGSTLVDLETELDSMFAGELVDSASLKTTLASIGEVKANLRHSHLNAHLEQKKILTMHQVHIYNQLRGYDGAQSIIDHSAHH